MEIPNEVLSAFNKETEGLAYGSVSIGIYVRGSHKHYEINKHITFQNENQQAESDNRKKNKNV